MRLIDADALKNLPFERMIHTDFGETAIPIEEIDNAPTVITEEYIVALKNASAITDALREIREDGGTL